MDRLYGRLKKGAEQIREQNLPGYIFVDFRMARYQQNEPIEEASEDFLIRVDCRKFTLENVVLQENGLPELINRFLNDDLIRGIYFTEALHRFTEDEEWEVASINLFKGLSGSSQKHESEFWKFGKRLENGQEKMGQLITKI